ncbi:MAG: hypothetical protein PF637_14890 [Spirochaetes bacterium]|jgi:hypothetical protein|nr:hypothetical protein [Spirochaetota bacterium]
MKRKIRIMLISIIVLLSLPVLAQEPEKNSANLSLTASTLPEFQASADYTFVLPANTDLKVKGSVSPVTVKAESEAVWTPVPFLQLVAAGSAGTGWNIDLADGLRINEPDGETGNRLVGDNCDGVVYGAGLGGAFQFDLAAIMPGEWNHLLFRTYHSCFYQGLTSADNDQSWMYENDEGENRNGLNYYANYFIGYKMPVKLSMIGVLFESDLRLYDTKNGSDWGDDLVRWTISPLVSFDFTEKLSGTCLVQFRTERNYIEGTGDNDFYQTRRIDKDNTRSLTFYRAVFILGYKLGGK